MSNICFKKLVKTSYFICLYYSIYYVVYNIKINIIKSLQIDSFGMMAYSILYFPFCNGWVNLWLPVIIIVWIAAQKIFFIIISWYNEHKIK